MPQHKETNNAMENNDMENDLHTEVDLLAERYLDLWQDNLRHWATDPNAFEKWLAEATSQITSSRKKTSSSDE